MDGGSRRLLARPRLGAALDGPTTNQVTTAHALLRSHVEHRTASVHDLSPTTVGTFDVVFCSSLLMELSNPILAFCNIRSVTRGLAIIGTTVDPELAEGFLDQPCGSVVVTGFRSLAGRPTGEPWPAET